MPGYGLSAPRALDALTQLAHCVGGVEALQRWGDVTRRLGLHGMDLDVDDLQRVADAFMAQGGAPAVLARGWDVRLRAYRTLTARTTRAGAHR